MLEYIKAREDANRAFVERLKLDAANGDQDAVSRLSALIEFHVGGKKREPGWYVTHPWFDPDNLKV